MSRELKRNKTKLEKLIMETWYDTNRGNNISTCEQEIAVKAIKETLRYFEMEDYLYRSNHAETINVIYLSNKYKKKSPSNKKNKRIIIKTRAALAIDMYTSRNTLSKNTDIYIKCFEKYLNDFYKEK